MKERPILFSAPMIRALLAGAKTQTRRIVKPQPERGGVEGAPELGEGWIWWPRGTKRERYNNPCGVYDLAHAMVCSPFAYAYKGDRLWVRETWQPIWAGDKRPSSGSSEGWAIGYPATDGVQEYHDEEHGLTTRCKPAIFLPRWASRITLEVTAVRVERLHAITEEDGRAEGVTFGEPQDAIINGERGRVCFFNARDAFAYLWASINGADSWKANPWVWVVEFKRVVDAAKEAA